MRITSLDYQTGIATLAWSELECDDQNGLVTEYECVIYFANSRITDRVDNSVTTYTLPMLDYATRPVAFSVAAVNEAGTGDHCPRVWIHLFEFDTSRYSFIN